jgi:hypothetical protein
MIDRGVSRGSHFVGFFQLSSLRCPLTVRLNVNYKERQVPLHHHSRFSECKSIAVLHRRIILTEDSFTT